MSPSAKTPHNCVRVSPVGIEGGPIHSTRPAPPLLSQAFTLVGAAGRSRLQAAPSANAFRGARTITCVCLSDGHSLAFAVLEFVDLAAKTIQHARAGGEG